MTYENLKGEIIKVAKLNNFVYHGKLISEDESTIQVYDALIGLIRIKKEEIEKVIPCSTFMWAKFLDKITPKFGTQVITNKTQMHKQFDELRKKVEGDKNGTNIHTAT